jgi:hypothetical protein
MYQSSIEKKSNQLDPYVTLLGLLGTGSTGLHLQEKKKSIECAGAAFDKTNSFILEVMAECSKSPAVLVLPSTRSQTDR